MFSLVQSIIWGWREDTVWWIAEQARKGLLILCEKVWWSFRHEMKRVQFCYQGRCVTCWLSRRLWGTERPDGRLLLHMQRLLTYYILHKVYLWNKDATENETFFMAWTAFLFWKTFLHEKSNLIRRLLKDMVWEGELCNLELKQHLLKTPHVPDLEDSNRPEACELMSLCWRSLKGPTHIASALFLFRGHYWPVTYRGPCSFLGWKY